MGKASVHKRLRRERREALQSLRNHMDSDPGTRDLRWAPELGQSKISASLMKLIEPYIGKRRGLEELRAWAMIGAAAWNWTVEPDSFPREKLEEALKGTDRDENTVLHDVLDDLGRRKLELFPHDRWLIVKTEVIEQSDGSFYLTAAATAHEEELRQ